MKTKTSATNIPITAIILAVTVVKLIIATGNICPIVGINDKLNTNNAVATITPKNTIISPNENVFHLLCLKYVIIAVSEYKRKDPSIPIITVIHSIAVDDAKVVAKKILKAATARSPITILLFLSISAIFYFSSFQIVVLFISNYTASFNQNGKIMNSNINIA